MVFGFGWWGLIFCGWISSQPFKNEKKEKKKKTVERKGKEKGSPTHLLLFYVFVLHNAGSPNLPPLGSCCYCCFWQFPAASPAFPSCAPWLGALLCVWCSYRSLCLPTLFTWIPTVALCMARRCVLPQCFLPGSCQPLWEGPLKWFYIFLKVISW